jgi:L-ascorbate metabolism protein UlaG (beta-lactamase superfamily)
MTNKLTWYGHATLGLETGGYKLVIDPFFEGNPAASLSPKEVEADFLLVSHGHGDHVGDAVAIAKRTGATIISNYEIAGWFSEKGVEKTHGQHLGGGHKHPFGYLKLTLALHGSMLPDGSYGGNPSGFLLTPIGDNYTMGPDDALRAVKMLEPKVVIPIHYNTWPLLAQDANAWKECVEKETKTRVMLLKPGESYSF